MQDWFKIMWPNVFKMIPWTKLGVSRLVMNHFVTIRPLVQIIFLHFKVLG